MRRIRTIITVPCKHWQECGVQAGGCCLINEYERPLAAICLRVCKKYDGPDNKKAIAELEKQIRNPAKPSNGQLVSSFVKAHAALTLEGKVIDAVAGYRLTVCSGLVDGVRVTAACPKYEAKSDHCKACGCPDWKVAEMKRKVWYPYPICPLKRFSTARGRRRQKT